ncbi:hypothetical protein [Spartinivicinus poritis]|uniref:Uncharacterized protein n=1 Tax=Spartinivicinus poritis TaxID=2994640 RepID=A0ABT5UER1_9GAMM|nr:hypothetical protein [Spartinivicinus sp. A2-2]MDE1464869.1 hypothetical protein [Spartinivicinus sp. A2-2]
MKLKKLALIATTTFAFSSLSQANNNYDNDSCYQSGKGFSECSTSASWSSTNKPSLKKVSSNKEKNWNNQDKSNDDWFSKPWPSNNWPSTNWPKPNWPTDNSWPTDNNWPSPGNANSKTKLCQSIQKVDKLANWKTTGTAKLSEAKPSTLCKDKNEFHLTNTYASGGELQYQLKEAGNYQLEMVVHGINNQTATINVYACGSTSRITVSGSNSTGKVNSSVYNNCGNIRIFADDPASTIVIDKLKVSKK